MCVFSVCVFLLLLASIIYHNKRDVGVLHSLLFWRVVNLTFVTSTFCSQDPKLNGFPSGVAMETGLSCN